jgi:hypothetical protein
MTGLIFLNMSFFLSEIRILKLDVTDHELIVNVIKALSGTGFEDEKDSAGESQEGNSAEQIVDLHLFAPTAFSPIEELYQLDHASFYLLHLLSTAPEISTPPPKNSIA